MPSDSAVNCNYFCVLNECSEDEDKETKCSNKIDEVGEIKRPSSE